MVKILPIILLILLSFQKGCAQVNTDVIYLNIKIPHDTYGWCFLIYTDTLDNSFKKSENIYFLNNMGIGYVDSRIDNKNVKLKVYKGDIEITSDIKLESKFIADINEVEEIQSISFYVPSIQELKDKVDWNDLDVQSKLIRLQRTEFNRLVEKGWFK